MLKSTSLVRRSKAAKVRSLVGNLAIHIAKKREDPAYLKYKRAREMYLRAKKMLERKYSQVSRRAAMKLLVKR